ncbi:hypothetical protein F4777DRAFT_249272 [Nemania sp. FL0916]|nr:hypothetical protein F4777DRAFT_249272 [Nemania sp. FL0916]
MPSSSVNRPFSTATQVHPRHLPTLYKTGRLEKKFATATAAVVGIGYGMVKYKEYQERQHYQAAEAEAASRRQSETVMDAYADRSSLASLEAAVQAYEAQRRT